MRPRRLHSARRVTASVILTLALCGAPASATLAATPTDALTVTSFDADMTLGTDDDGHSTLLVVEHIVADFPQADENHGIRRVIPAVSGDSDLQTEVTNVTDAAGDPVPYTVADEGDGLFVTIGDNDAYLHGERAFDITYTQRDIVRSFADTDSQELYIDINGTDWDLPFGEVSTRVALDGSLASTLTGNLACYTGAEGDADSDCTIQREGDVIVSRTGHLDAGENLTIAVGFENGTFVEPAGARPSVLQIVAATLPWVLLGVVVALAGWVLWWRLARWRDAPGRGTIVPQYLPPAGICPLEAAEILRRRKRGFAAQLVAFAVSGVATLSEDRTAPRSRRYALTVTHPDAAETLDPLENRLLEALVGTSGTERHVVLDTRSRDIGDRLALRTRDAERSLITERYLETAPSTLRDVTRVPLIVVSIASILLSPFTAVAVGLPLTVATILATIAGGIVVYRYLADPRPRLTADGAQARDHLRGLAAYMTLAEADRMRCLQGSGTAQRVDVTDERAVVKLHEKLLPYAIVWGIEKTWITALGSEYATTEAPQWFTGSELVRVPALASAFTTSAFATTAAASAGATGAGATGASSIGGSMGGGFSGGGAGGGGGGGW